MPSHSLYLVSSEWQQSSLIFLFILSFLVMMVAMTVLVTSSGSSDNVVAMTTFKLQCKESATKTVVFGFQFSL